MIGFGASACGVRASAPVPGNELYRDCVSCHGPAGAGNAAITVPHIAGLPKWYIELQLQRFQAGLRGKHPDDYDGLRMRPMSQQLMSATEIDTVATYVSQLPPVTTPATLPHADPAAGQQAFALCATCHGAQGEGNPQVHSAPIAGMDDWYIARQLRKFRAGVRGKAEGDTIGPLMQGISMTIDPAAVDDIAAYVHSLPHPNPAAPAPAAAPPTAAPPQTPEPPAAPQ
jgi:cytochrome c553